MMDMHGLIKIAANMQIAIDALSALANHQFAGRSIVITTRFHDQPYGSSKPNQKGKKFIIDEIFLMFDSGGPRVYFKCEGLDHYVQPWQCELVQ